MQCQQVLHPACNTSMMLGNPAISTHVSCHDLGLFSTAASVCSIAQLHMNTCNLNGGGILTYIVAVKFQLHSLPTYERSVTA